MAPRLLIQSLTGSMGNRWSRTTIFNQNRYRTLSSVEEGLLEEHFANLQLPNDDEEEKGEEEEEEEEKE